jgi:hypothetical protein
MPRTLLAAFAVVAAAITVTGAGLSSWMSIFSSSHGLHAYYWALGTRVCMPDGSGCTDVRWGDLHDYQCYRLDAAVQADILARGVCHGDLDRIEACMIAERIATYGLDVSDPSNPHYGVVRDLAPVAAMYATMFNVIAVGVGSVAVAACTLAAVIHARTRRRQLLAVAAVLLMLTAAAAVSILPWVWSGDADDYEGGFWVFTFVFGLAGAAATSVFVVTALYTG